MVEIKLTDSEVHTLRFYLEKALIDARGWPLLVSVEGLRKRIWNLS